MGEFPNKNTQFQPGQSGNPGGLTREQIEQRKRNRDAAMAIEERLLSAVTRDLTEREEQALQHVRADVLRLIHTAIEREDGKPVARQELSSPDGTMSPVDHQSAVLAALRAKSGGDGA
jgi:hypothetical protein